MTDSVDAPQNRPRALLVGAGSLGKAVLRTLRDQDSPVQLVGVMTARHGTKVDPAGLDASLALNLVESEGLGTEGPQELGAILETVSPQVLIECIPQNIRSGEPSLTILRQALEAGVNVITSNKAAIVLGYRDLLHRAAKTNTQIRFEATVLDGLPIFSTLSSLKNNELRKIRGVLNATSSLVLESVQAGSTRSRGLARAQAQGIAEADAVLDLDGWDAAAKAALLANVCLGGTLRVVDVVRTGCESLKDDALKELGEDQKVRLIAEIVKDEAGVRAKVEPVTIGTQDPFFSLRGGSGGITFESSRGYSFTLLQQSHGLDDAAFAIVQDCYSIARGH